jgi:hypothetical protein
MLWRNPTKNLGNNALIDISNILYVKNNLSICSRLAAKATCGQMIKRSLLGNPDKLDESNNG